MNQNSEVMANLKLSLNKLTKRIKHKDIIYIDFPLHHNVGDQLIYLGAVKLLENAGFNIVASFSVQNYSRRKVKKILREHPNEVSIILHGGGNFGDLYGAHQNLRREVVDLFPDNNTVIFPQTVYYKDHSILKQDELLFAKHTDLSFFVRDLRSQNAVDGFCDNVELCPDTAHMLWDEEVIKPTNLVTKNELVLRRWDIEGDNDKKNFDWKQLLSLKSRLFKNTIFAISLINPFAFIDRKIEQIWYRHSLALCQYSAGFFHEYKIINTDRLHGHILACLLSKPNVVQDNSYGKNSDYINQWTKTSELVEMLTRANEQ